MLFCLPQCIVNALGRYERSEAIPSVEIAAKIASELETSLDYLIGLSELGIDVIATIDN